MTACAHVAPAYLWENVYPHTRHAVQCNRPDGHRGPHRFVNRFGSVQAQWTNHAVWHGNRA